MGAAVFTRMYRLRVAVRSALYGLVLALAALTLFALTTDGEWWHWWAVVMFATFVLLVAVDAGLVWTEHRTFDRGIAKEHPHVHGDECDDSTYLFGDGADDDGTYPAY